MSDKKRIAVIFGGQSSEHEVSRVSAQSVISNLDKDKYEVVMVGITKDGRWLNYDGPVEKLGTGEWQAIAEAKVARQFPEGAFPGYKALAGSSVRDFLKASSAETENKNIDVVFGQRSQLW